MIDKTEEWLYKKAKEVDKELELQDLYTGKFSFGGRWVMELLKEYHKEQLTLTDVVHCKITVLITYWTIIDSGHAMIDDYRTKVSRIVEVDKLSDLNDKYNNLVDVKILK